MRQVSTVTQPRLGVPGSRARGIGQPGTRRSVAYARSDHLHRLLEPGEVSDVAGPAVGNHDLRFALDDGIDEVGDPVLGGIGCRRRSVLTTMSAPWASAYSTPSRNERANPIMRLCRRMLVTPTARAQFAVGTYPSSTRRGVKSTGPARSTGATNFALFVSASGGGSRGRIRSLLHVASEAHQARAAGSLRVVRGACRLRLVVQDVRISTSTARPPRNDHHARP